LEHQHHLHRPRTDASNHRQLLDDVSVFEGVECGGIGDTTLLTLQREIADRRDFGGRESCAAQAIFFDSEHGAWRRKIVAFVE